MTVLALSSHLDPTRPPVVDAALAASGGLPGALSGAADGDADPVRPAAVPLGDYARVIAEYWADGPDSETPPGHWLRLYNEHVAAHPALDRRPGGVGAPLDPLAFDLLAYLALGGALHDVAIAAWSIKGAYDSVRPISAVRYLAEPRAVSGRRSTSAVGSLKTVRLPTVPGLIEPVELGDPLAGPGGIDVGRLKVLAWRGPRAVRDPEIDVAGVGWILARDWWPYQRPSFVTPPFAGYVSGHSTFSSAAATVLERLTGSPDWPGGAAGFVAPANDFLVFERGPSVDVPLAWPTYRAAADESALSRLWGGIHVPADDLPGRRIGARVGDAAWHRAVALAGVDVGTSADDDVPDPPGPAPMGTSASAKAPARGALQGCSVGADAGGTPAALLLAAALWRGLPFGRRRRRTGGLRA